VRCRLAAGGAPVAIRLVAGVQVNQVRVRADRPCRSSSG
jgi:hypothetical protein